jgi:Hydrazine synthase alpha subunit middle domain
MNILLNRRIASAVCCLAFSLFVDVATASECTVSQSALAGKSAGNPTLSCSLDDQPFDPDDLPELEAGGGEYVVVFESRESVSDKHILRVLKSVYEAYVGSIERGAGIRLKAGEGSGNSLVAESLSLPDEGWRARIVLVDIADLGRKGLSAFRKAAETGKAQQTFYYLHGDVPADRAKAFFTACDTYRVSCAGHWGSATGGEEKVLVSELRRRHVLPAISGASVNTWAENGHYNRGIGWQPGKIESTAEGLVVPLRFYDSSGEMTEDRASFDITLRRGHFLHANRGQKVDWAIAGTDQRGSAIVTKDRTLFLEGLSLQAGEAYRKLVIKPAAISWQVVYTRQPRATASVHGTPIEEAANWQHATDVGRINYGLSEADIVLDDLRGNTKVIHNCTTSKEVCVAHEARVSPDGTKIVYSLGRGWELTPVFVQGLNLGIQEIPGLASAELWIYDLLTDKKWKIPHHPQTAIDRQPDWLSNNKIVFTSNRGGTYPFRNPVGMHQGKDQYGKGRCFNAPYCVSQEYGYGPGGMSMQLWTMNIDGTQATNISPHDQMALAPAVMSSGDIVYSCWNSQENKSFDASTSHSNHPATSKNKWWLCRTDANGADTTVILNAHKTTTIKTKEWLGRGMHGGENRSQLRAIRSVAEIFKDKLGITNYYRSNHVGSMGIVFQIDYDDPHVEGCLTASCYPHGEIRSGRPGSGQYVPSSLIALTPYGTDQDIAIRRDSNGRALGKAGYPAPLPNTDKEFLITHGRGSCYEVTKLGEANRYAMGGEPTCQKGIYKVKVPMVTDPFDKRQLEMVAGGPKWQAWDGRAIAPYKEFFDQELPDQLEPLDANDGCYLQVVDAREAELYPSAERYDWHSNLYQQCAFQGCAVNTEDERFHRNNMEALTIFLPEMWDFTYGNGKERAYQRMLSNTGHKSMGTLGSQPLLEDGSVKMKVPCETPFIMAGTDKDGTMIAYDMMVHSLRAGETRTCHGCHDGHSEERAAQFKRPAVERFAATMAAKTTPAMPRKMRPITFADVQPILEKRCSGCHRDMTNHDGLLYSRVAQDYEQHDWPWARKQPGNGNRTHIAHVLIQRGGQGYAVGEKLNFPPGGASGHVMKVGPRGDITELRLTSAGNNYPPYLQVGVHTAKGKGATLTGLTELWNLSRPYSSKWVSRFARDSLLYWKCVGKRMDGRKDSQYGNDIDFGPEHSSGATHEECQIIGRWIDTGIQHVLK